MKSVNKVKISKSEWWPFYTIEDDGKLLFAECHFTPEQYFHIKTAMRMFHEAQSMISEALEEAGHGRD